MSTSGSSVTDNWFLFKDLSRLFRFNNKDCWYHNLLSKTNWSLCGIRNDRTQMFFRVTILEKLAGLRSGVQSSEMSPLLDFMLVLLLSLSSFSSKFSCNCFWLQTSVLEKFTLKHLTGLLLDAYAFITCFLRQFDNSFF